MKIIFELLNTFIKLKFTLISWDYGSMILYSVLNIRTFSIHFNFTIYLYLSQKLHRGMFIMN